VNESWFRNAPSSPLAWVSVVLLAVATVSICSRGQGKRDVASPLMMQLVPTPAGNTGAPSIAVDVNGRPVVAWSHTAAGEPVIYLLQWTGEHWAELGHSASGRGLSNTAGRALAPWVQVDSRGRPHVAWQDLSYGNYEVYFRRWNGNAWEEAQDSAAKGGVSQTLSGLSVNPELALDGNGQPILAWEERFEASSDIYVRRLETRWRGMAWQDIGGKPGIHGGMGRKLGRSAFPSIALDQQDRPVIAWQDTLAGEFQIFLRRWTGSKWEELGGSATDGGISRGQGTALAASVALDSSGRPMVAWQQELSGISAIYFAHWDGREWQGLGSSNSGAGVSGGLPQGALPSLVSRGGNPAIAFQAGQPGHTRVYVRRWNGASWEAWPGTEAGMLIQPGAKADNVRLVAHNNGICLAWRETLGKESRIAVNCL
jgi:hypothetical protein